MLPCTRWYCSAIVSSHRGFSDGSSIWNSLVVSRILRSFFLLQRPHSRSLIPSWSLPAVLNTLSEDPFEPFAKASLHHMTLQTAFLVAIASGQRRGTIHALSTAAGHIRWEKSGVRLIPHATFIAKNQTASSKPVENFLPSISLVSSIAEDKLWCPVRALKWYMSRTRHLRSSQLFIATIVPHNAVSHDTISRWLVEAIKLTGDKGLCPGPVRAHDTRGISASWALFNGASLDQIQQAAYWANSNSFITCYLKDVIAHEAGFATSSLSVSRAHACTS